MRFWLAIAATLLLAQCASRGDDDRFVVGQSAKAYVFIGAAEAADATDSTYAMTWRRVDPGTGQFTEFNGRNAFVAETNANNTLRIRGIPGEFTHGQIEPGFWALDNIYAVIHDRRVNYYANGVVTGADRPSFRVRAGEAVYLGIWEMRVNDTLALTRLWRLDPSDLHAVIRAARATVGEVEPRDVTTLAVPCTPHRVNSLSQRQIC